MSEDRRRLTEEENQKAMAFLNEKIAGGALECEICKEDKFVLIDDFLVVHSLRKDTDRYPYIGIMCNTCGNTKMLSALMSGILSLVEGRI